MRRVRLGEAQGEVQQEPVQGARDVALQGMRAGGQRRGGGAASLAAGSLKSTAPPGKGRGRTHLVHVLASLGTSVGKDAPCPCHRPPPGFFVLLGHVRGSALFDQLSSKGAAASSVSEGMSLAEFSASRDGDDLGLNSQGLEVGTCLEEVGKSIVR